MECNRARRSGALGTQAAQAVLIRTAGGDSGSFSWRPPSGASSSQHVRGSCTAAQHCGRLLAANQGLLSTPTVVSQPQRRACLPAQVRHQHQLLVRLAATGMRARNVRLAGLLAHSLECVRVCVASSCPAATARATLSQSLLVWPCAQQVLNLRGGKCSPAQWGMGGGQPPKARTPGGGPTRRGWAGWSGSRRSGTAAHHVMGMRHPFGLRAPAATMVSS